MQRTILSIATNLQIQTDLTNMIQEQKKKESRYVLCRNTGVFDWQTLSKCWHLSKSVSRVKIIQGVNYIGFHRQGRYRQWDQVNSEGSLFFSNQKSSPAGLVLELEMWRHLDTKQKAKSFTLCHCVLLYGLVYPGPRF